MSITKQIFYIVMEKIFGVCRSLRLIARKWVISIKIMKVSVHIAISACCIAISHPSLAESPLVIPRDACSKITNSSLQCGEFSLEFTAKLNTVPSSKDGIEVTKLSQNDIPKLSGRNAVSDISLNSKKTKDGEECDEYCYFQYLFPLWIRCIFYALNALGLTLSRHPI